MHGNELVKYWVSRRHLYDRDESPTGCMPYQPVYKAEDVARAFTKTVNDLITAMEAGHYKMFTFTLKGFYCPKCNTAWPCGHVAKAHRLLALLQGEEK